MSFEMPEQEQHTMEFVVKHDTGEDELYCPTCGRRILLQWPPNYKKTVLEPGNEYAIHSGGKGGIVMGTPHVSLDEKEDKDSEIDDQSLAPWRDWMDQVDFNQLWN